MFVYLLNLEPYLQRQRNPNPGLFPEPRIPEAQASLRRTPGSGPPALSSPRTEESGPPAPLPSDPGTQDPSPFLPRTQESRPGLGPVSQCGFHKAGGAIHDPGGTGKAEQTSEVAPLAILSLLLPQRPAQRGWEGNRELWVGPCVWFWVCNVSVWYAPLWVLCVCMEIVTMCVTFHVPVFWGVTCEGVFFICVFLLPSCESPHCVPEFGCSFRGCFCNSDWIKAGIIY